MIPCDENHRDAEVCKDSESPVTQTSPAGHFPSSPVLPLSRMQESHRRHN
jgi:hypothetical protein